MRPAANLADVIGHYARTTPHAVAVEERGRSWNYLEFDRAIWRAAASFRARGIAPGDMVGISLPSNALHLVVGYALARLGAIQVPLSEKESPDERLARMERFHAVATLSAGDADAAWLDSRGAPCDEALRAPGGDAPWKVVMTSGTTSAPKAVLQTHAMHIAWRTLTQSAIPLQAADRHLAIIPLDFFSSFRVCTDVHWAGAAVIVGEAPATLTEFLETVERTSASYLYLTPVHLHQLVTNLSADRPRLPGLRLVRTGSMTVPERLRRQVVARLSPSLIVSYGTNEVGSPFALADGGTLTRYPGSVGFPVAGIKLRITDEAGRVLPPGEIGEVAVQAPGMPGGYADNPEASARAFRDGWYYPGDLGELSADGVLYLHGRVDDLMNFDGIKIYPAEIESVLLDHPAVAEAAALPLRSVAHQHIPVAGVVLRQSIDIALLESYCTAQLGVRAPRKIAILPALPRNAAGKVNKRELARIIMQDLRS